MSSSNSRGTNGETWDRYSFRAPDSLMSAVDVAVENREHHNRSVAIRHALREVFVDAS